MIDAFRLINQQSQIIGQEPRQTTSNIGHLHKPSIQVDSFNLGTYSWIKSALLLHCYQLPQKRVGAKDVVEFTQKELDRRFEIARF